jgi:hypothetical protein
MQSALHQYCTKLPVFPEKDLSHCPNKMSRQHDGQTMAAIWGTELVLSLPLTAQVTFNQSLHLASSVD